MVDFGLRRRFVAAVFLLLGCACGDAAAGNLAVKPIRLALEPGQLATSLTVGNEGDSLRLVQVSVLRWTRQDGEDRLSADQGRDAPLVTPPLFRVAPGGSQVVRIGFRKPPPAAALERAWRVIVEEVPQQAGEPEVTGSVPGTTIAMRLRIIMPLLLPPAAPHRALHWEGSVDAAGVPRLTALNDGNVSERIDDLLLATPGGEHELGRLSGPIYLFPGEQRVLAPHATAGVAPGPATLQLQGTPRPLVSDLILRAQ